MKKRFNKFAGFLLMIVITLSFLTAEALASENIRTDAPVSLTVSATYASRALNGVSYTLYKVADYNEAGSITFEKDFRDYPVVLEPQNLTTATAETLEAYVQRDKISPIDTGKAVDGGCVTFPASGETLFPGIYLLVMDPLSQNGYTYESSPMLLSLPYLDADSDSFAYDLSYIEKSTRIENINTSINLSAVKVWQADSSKDRPQQITLRLLCNGEPYDTVTLTEADGWQYTWEGLPSLGTDGVVNRWTAAEDEVPGYTVKITSIDSMFRITNTAVTPTPTPDIPEKLPQTGVLWWPVPILFMFGALCLLLGGSLKKIKNKGK